jgi:hypothetical protein
MSELRDVDPPVPAGRSNKRDTDRVQILGELHGEVMVFQPMAVHGLSRGGAEIDTAFPLQLNSLHDLRLTLGDQSVVVKGRVAHCSISDVDQESVTYRSGMEFVELPVRVASAIGAFIEAIRDGRRAP